VSLTDTATTRFSDTLVTLINKQVETNLRDNLVWFMPGAVRTARIIPGTNQARYVGYGDLTVDASAVTLEGSPNTAEEMTIGYQTLTVAQRMRRVQISDVAMDESPHDLVAVASERIARNAAEVVDFVISTAAAAITGTNFADGVANRDALTTGGVLNRDEVAKIVAAMKAANIPAFPDGYYRAIIHPNVAYDLQADTSVGGWIEVSKYAQPGNMLNGEIGALLGVRFILSNKGTHVGNGEGVGDAFAAYRNYFFGPDWMAFGDLQTVRTYFVSPGGDHTDPAAQQAVLAWKGMYGVEILGDDVEGALKTVTGGDTKYRILETIGTLPG
jgi:N4-gp56 family major capsid protein